MKKISFLSLILFVFPDYAMDYKDTHSKPTAFVIIGPSGCGKTAFADALASKIEDTKLTKVQRLKIEYLFNYPNALPEISAEEKKKAQAQLHFDLEHYDESQASPQEIAKSKEYISYMQMKRFNNELEKMLLKESKATYVLDYVAQDKLSRDDFVRLVTQTSIPILIKLHCLQAIAEKRSCKPGRKSFVKEHFENAHLYDYHPLSFSETIDTTSMTFSDYETQADVIIQKYFLQQ